MILRSLVLMHYQRATNTQTDGHTVNSRISCLLAQQRNISNLRFWKCTDFEANLFTAVFTSKEHSILPIHVACQSGVYYTKTKAPIIIFVIGVMRCLFVHDSAFLLHDMSRNRCSIWRSSAHPDLFKHIREFRRNINLTCYVGYV